MKHYIIVKFKEGFDYLKQLDRISKLFDESLKIEGVDRIKIYTSNCDLSNRYDLMIRMELTKKALTDFDASWIHQKWKTDYSEYIEDKTIFDCD